MRLLRPLFLLFSSLILVSTQARHNQDDIDDQNNALRPPILSEANMQFAVAFYKTVSSKPARAPPNIFVSPLSLSKSLTMLALGAKSTTRQGILEGLFLNITQGDMQALNTEYKNLLKKLSDQEGEVEINLGNWFFVGESTDIVPKYKQDVARYYNASIKKISFKNPQVAEKNINDFVREQTGGEIQDFVSNLDTQTKLVLIDLMSFNAQLKYPFDTQETQDADFIVNEQRTVRVPMLHKRGFYKTFKDNDLQCTVVEVPCVGDNILLLIVPKLGRLDRIEQRLTAELIKNYLRQTRTSTLDFYMPKINFEGQINADYALLGMNFPIFGDDADFSGISEQSRLKVSHIAHKILFDVPEEEIEAKSASSMQGFVVPAPVLRVDRPFFAMVYNKPTDTILLLGRYMDPER